MAGVYWVKLTENDPGELLRFDGQAFRAGATVRPYWEWREATAEELAAGFRCGNWCPRYEGSKRGKAGN